MKILRAPSFKMASPCSRFAARFPKARAASLETKDDEDPSAYFHVHSRCGGGRDDDGQDTFMSGCVV